MPDANSTVLEAVPSTALDGLRAEFAKKIEPKRLHKRFPGVGGKLVGEFRTADKETVRATAETGSDEYMLEECLIRILIEDPDHHAADEKGLVPLGLWADRPELDPVRFNHQFCELVNIPRQTPDEIALRLFDDNDLQLAQMVGEIGEWSLDTRKEAFSDFPSA